MPIFAITYEHTLVVEANSLEDAEENADQHFRDVRFELDGEYTCIEPVVSTSELPHGWDGKCIPLGGDGNTMLEELLPATPFDD